MREEVSYLWSEATRFVFSEVHWEIGLFFL